MNITKTTILQKLFEPRDIAILVYFRFIFGAIMLWEVFRYFEHDWISKYWIEPTFHFTYYGFDWVKPWPGDFMYLHFAAMGVLSICILVGFKYRICTILFFLAFSQIFFSEQSRYLNHFYLIWLVSFVLIFIPANRAFSIDSWLNKKIRTDFISAYSIWLLRILVGIPYFFGGIAKLNPDWLAGYPLRFWLESEADTFPLLGQFFTEEWFVMFFAYGALFVDLLAVPFLLWRRSRIFAYVILVSFHLLNAQLFSIGIFPWFMIFATLVFFDPSWPRVLKRFKVSKKQKSKITTLSKNQKIVLSLILIFLVVQITLPLRHYAYPGNVSWTEEGHNFAWHMKLRDKDTVFIEFTATDPSTGRSWVVDHDEDLTQRQESKMSTRPDMILQYSHFLAEKYRNQGYDDIEIRVDMMSSVNGRDYQKLIDPDVDLTKEPRTLLPKSWIVPLED
ncbi:HTTM domain-containing protein [Nitrosopumilus sp.]|uniref:HTTM domain-containing protein n=1 Tax=Nitrosopumilus sp. TaxID=2024843 RepID=UPI003D1151F5